MTTTRTTNRSRNNRDHRNTFGSVRKFPNGRFQVRFTDAQMQRHTAPVTFPGRR